MVDLLQADNISITLFDLHHDLLRPLLEVQVVSVQLCSMFHVCVHICQDVVAENLDLLPLALTDALMLPWWHVELLSSLVSPDGKVGKQTSCHE